MERRGLAATVSNPDGAATSRPQWWRLLAVGLELALLVAVLHRFELESSAVLRLSLVALAGFAVHAVLPRDWRLPFFALLSVAAIAVILGPVNGAWLVGLGLVLIAICHLPVGWTARVVLLVGAGVVLALLRSGRLEAPFSGAIWPILGSMFMFRLIAYVYDLRHEKVKPDLWRTLSYFFLLPNVCFPLFPVVGYKTFRRTYYDREETTIYQNGIRWMLRGLVHLLLYRLVYHHLSLTPLEVDNGGDLAQFVLSNYALYLRISGQFHFIVGLLQLFGFNLPETHHRYYLAASFSDFWRRINIYWKDFMMRVFYYPMLFRLQRHGGKLALVVATVMVFVLTWLLHSYQWFWLLGSFPVTVQDMAFWGLLGLLVVGNSLWEMRRKPAVGKDSSEGMLLPTFWRGVRTALFFVVMAALWSLWTSESVAEWADMWRTGARGGWSSAWWLLPVLVVIGAAGALEGRGGRLGKAQSPPFWRSVGLSAATAAVLLALTVPAVSARLGKRVGPVVANLGQAELNEADHERLRRGYYEKLTRVERFNSQLWEIYVEKDEVATEVGGTYPFIRTGSIPTLEIIPNFRGTFLDKTYTSNRFGMRDQEYDLLKPRDTYRIAIVGASLVMGEGVTDDEVFSAIVEERLNREATGGRYRRFEILNFAVAGSAPLQNALVVQEKVVPFAPDALIYGGHFSDPGWSQQRLVERMIKGIRVPYPELLDLAREVGVTSGMNNPEMMRRLQPRQQELLELTYKRIVGVCRDHGIKPIHMIVPDPRDGSMAGEELAWAERLAEKTAEHNRLVDKLTRLADSVGFETLNLEGVFEHEARTELWVSHTNRHPNARGHKLIAERLYNEILANQQALGLDLPSSR